MDCYTAEGYLISHIFPVRNIQSLFCLGSKLTTENLIIFNTFTGHLFHKKSLYDINYLTLYEVKFFQ